MIWKPYFLHTINISKHIPGSHYIPLFKWSTTIYILLRGKFSLFTWWPTTKLGSWRNRASDLATPSTFYWPRNNYSLAVSHPAEIWGLPLSAGSRLGATGAVSITSGSRVCGSVQMGSAWVWSSLASRGWNPKDQKAWTRHVLVEKVILDPYPQGIDNGPHEVDPYEGFPLDWWHWGYLRGVCPGRLETIIESALKSVLKGVWVL